MILYRVVFVTPTGRVTSWHLSRHVADATLRLALQETPQPTMGSVSTMVVPTTKQGLVRWLNDQFNPANEGPTP